MPSSLSTAPVPLVLASSSPRRHQLLLDAGFAHTVISPAINDAQLCIPPNVPPHHWACTLAYLKARSASDRAPPGSVILAADTIVLKDGDVLGQPRDEHDARRILRALSGGTHGVITGVALLTRDQRILFSDSATVSVGELTDRMIEPYLASGSWKGKAGAYNLAERLAENWPIACEGDPATVMGLPIARLATMLPRLGVRRQDRST